MTLDKKQKVAAQKNKPSNENKTYWMGDNCTLYTR